jgi:cytidylate kinase
MTAHSKGGKYTPRTYAERSLDAAELADMYLREWEQRRIMAKEREPEPVLPPTICFSRKIGVGALEVADILAQKIGYKVVDREILEYIANRARLSEKTVSLFDERYPGKIREFLSLAFGEKAFIKSDYTRELFSAVFSIAGLGPTIFVGRGAHLLLARDRVLAVRFLCSKSYRIKRLAKILNVKEEEAQNKLDQIDKEQREFFKSVYGKKDASPYEFDMVINCDYMNEPDWAAEVVALAFKQKFGSETISG